MISTSAMAESKRCLIWATYPNMGIDDRNQQDMVRSMPGGVAGVEQMVADFHRRGVRVLFPMMMWDQGTRDPGKPWPEAIAEFMKQIECRRHQRRYAGRRAAGFFSGCGESRPSAGIRTGGSDRADEALAWNVMTWGQYSSFHLFPRWIDSGGWRRATWSTSPIAGTATKPTIFSSHSSTARDGRVGRTSGVSGTE